MKKLLLLLLIFLLVGCNKSPNTTPNPPEPVNNFPFEKDYNTEMKTDYVSCDIAPCAEGIYYFFGFYLHFYDYATGQDVFVCNKPNCKHDQETDQLIGQECNAYADNVDLGGGMINCYTLTYHDGNLYAQQRVSSFQVNDPAEDYDEIIRIVKDSSTREAVLHLDPSRRFSDFIIHRGYLYYVAQPREGGSSLGIFRYDLSGKDKEQKLLLDSSVVQGPYWLIAKDDNLFFSCDKYRDSSAADHYNAIVKYNLNDQRVELLVENINDAMIKNFTFIDDDRLLYYKDFKTYLYNFKTREDSVVSDCGGYIAVGENYIYLFNGQNRLMRHDDFTLLEVYDKDLKLIDRTKIDFHPWVFPVGLIGDSLYFDYEESSDQDAKNLVTYKRRMFVEDGKLKSEIFDIHKKSDENFSGYYYSKSRHQQ